MVWLRKTCGTAAVLAILPIVACSGGEKLVGSDGSTAGSSGGGSSGMSGQAGAFGAVSGAGPGSDSGKALGDPCLPDDESVANFAGFQATEVNIADQFAGCASHVCVIN